MQTASTSPRTREAAETLVRIAAELEDAKSDVALLEHLKSAADRAKRLTAEHKAALTEHEAALAADAKAAEASRFVGLLSIEVADLKPEIGLTGAPFRITYTRLSYDMYARDNVPTPVKVEGFDALPNNVFDFLIERHPEQIPDRIASLVPGNPREAFKRYFMGRRRGYIN